MQICPICKVAGHACRSHESTNTMSTKVSTSHTPDLTVFNMRQLLRGSCLLYTFGSGHDATFVQPTFTVALMPDASRPSLWLCGCFQLNTKPHNYRQKKMKNKKTAEKKSKHPNPEFHALDPIYAHMHVAVHQPVTLAFLLCDVDPISPWFRTG